ncbi:hypothetical protein O3P69_003665 [Scylla paramamosain]|uniref:Uncharacterized protein n=1 Tax=Scylla paramamosain TaxID=85552 RepID=A0AAW0UME2_SCYPA
MIFEVNKLQPARIASLSLHREGWPDPEQVTGYCLPSSWPAARDAGCVWLCTSRVNFTRDCDRHPAPGRRTQGNQAPVLPSST